MRCLKLPDAFCCFLIDVYSHVLVEDERWYSVATLASMQFLSGWLKTCHFVSAPKEML